MNNLITICFICILLIQFTTLWYITEFRKQIRKQKAMIDITQEYAFSLGKQCLEHQEKIKGLEMNLHEHE